MLKVYILLASIATILGCGNNDLAQKSSQEVASQVQLCPVTQEPIGSMGPGYEYLHEGKTYIFCCKMCVNTFKRNPEKYMAEES